MRGVWRGENDGLYFRISQCFVEAIHQWKTFCVCVLARVFRVTQYAHHYTYFVALALYVINEVLSPAAKADDGSIQHYYPKYLILNNFI